MSSQYSKQWVNCCHHVFENATALGRASVQEPGYRDIYTFYSPTGWVEKYIEAQIVTLFGYPGKGRVSPLMEIN